VAYGRRETQETAGKLQKPIKMTAIAASGKQVTLPDQAQKNKPPAAPRRLQSLMHQGLRRGHALIGEASEVLFRDDSSRREQWPTGRSAAHARYAISRSSRQPMRT
jgi:hypothetical protein